MSFAGLNRANEQYAAAAMWKHCMEGRGIKIARKIETQWNLPNRTYLDAICRTVLTDVICDHVRTNQVERGDFEHLIEMSAQRGYVSRCKKMRKLQRNNIMT